MNIEKSLALEEQRLYVPYRDGPGYGAGFPNIGFIDLVNEPGRIGEIPEIAFQSEFKRLIIFLNDKKSGFFTLRTDSGYDFIPEEGFDHTFFSLLTLAVRRLKASEDKTVFELMYSEFIKFTKNKKNNYIHSKIHFRISPLNIPSENYDGTCLDLFVHGFGFSQVTAKRKWIASFRLLVEFIENFNSSLISGYFDWKFK